MVSPIELRLHLSFILLEKLKFKVLNMDLSNTVINELN